jgi:hypothetical protein
MGRRAATGHRSRPHVAREAPKVRDLPKPRKNESAAGGAIQWIFQWPYRAILAFLIWARVRPWHLTILALALNVVTGVLIITGDWFVAAWALLAAGLSDVFDGSVARHHGQQKRSGAFMDSVLARVSDAILFACLVVALWAPLAALHGVLQVTKLGMVRRHYSAPRGVGYLVAQGG